MPDIALIPSRLTAAERRGSKSDGHRGAGRLCTHYAGDRGAGQLLHQMCIRDSFIAVTDGVDSTQGDNEFTPFRNIITEWHTKNTSKKIRAVMKVKGNAVEHLTLSLIHI